MGSFPQFTALYPCGSTIWIYNGTGNQTINEQIDQAISRWHNKISASNISDLPDFARTSEASQAVITIRGATPGSPYCGAVSGGNLDLYTGSVCDGNKGNLADVLTHELSHAYGWSSGAHKFGVAGASDHCAIHLPNDGGLNSQVCAHEVEGAAAGYGLRAFDSQTFWSKEFVVSASALSPVSIVQGAIYQYSTPLAQLDRGGATTGSFSWQSLNTGVATVNGSGLVTGVAVGSALIRLQGGTSTTYLTTNGFETNAASVTVTVTPPPIAALYVDDITMNDSIPITHADSFTWTAVPASGDASGITYNWIIEFSDASPPDSIFVSGSGNTWRGYARPGSYNIRIKVSPVRNDSIGSPAIRDFPVCTSETNYLRAPDNDTDAVGGCS